MAIESKNHRPSPVKAVLSSQASHTAAAGPKEPKFESYEAERAWLVERKNAIDIRLMDYNSAAFSAAQHKIRKDFGGAHNQAGSLRAWLAKRAEMDIERKSLVKQKQECEWRLAQIRERAMQERIKANARSVDDIVRPNGELNYGAIGLRILEELVAIRKLLESQNKEPK